MTQATTPKVTLTPRAAKEISKLVKDRGLNPETAGLRVGMKGGGCSGFEYVCDLVPKFDKFDEVIELEDQPDGGRAIIDRKSLIFMEGTVIDYKRALMGTGFTFTNPNETANCGCGSSFAV